MIEWALLPPRWYWRPRLVLAAAAATALLIAAASDRRAELASVRASAVVIAQAAGPDPQRRERAGAAALAMLRASAEVADARLVSREDLLDWLRQAGVTTIPDELAGPTTIEARLRRAVDRAPVTARLRTIPGIVVATSGAIDPPLRTRWLLDGLAAATLLTLVASAEARPLMSALRVLHQLGATGGQRAALLLLTVAGSALTGALAGGIVAAIVRPADAPWPALGWAVLATISLLVAALLPALRVPAAERR